MSDTVSTKKQTTMPLLSHLIELRRGLIISAIALAGGFAAALFLYDPIIEFLFKPLLALSSSSGTGGNVLFVNSIAEGFLVKLKVSALTGFIISTPVHLFNVLHFIFPGLLKKEKRIVIITLIFSFLFIGGSFFYSYYTIIPVSVVFLTGQGFIPENTGILLNFSGNIFYLLQFMLITMVVFQLPIVLEILLIMNVVKRKFLWKTGKYLVVLFFLIAALVTPPDFVTQIGIALPMTVLFYLTILIAKIFRFGED